MLLNPRHRATPAPAPATHHRATSVPATRQRSAPAPGPRRRKAVLLASAASVCSLCLLGAAAPPVPLGIGDRLYPTLGNPGYDVASYDVDLTYPGANDKPLQAVTTIDAWATADLDRLNLDFARGTVRSVEVDGVPADFQSAGEDLVVTPVQPLRRGDWVRITVRHTSDPRPTGDQKGDGGWVPTTDGLVMANQADAAHLVFPCNDHPSDKAMFTFRVTAPNAYTVVANGLPTGSRRTGSSTTWTYRTEHPMATELAQVSIGRSDVPRREGPHGLPLRDVVPSADRKTLEPWLAKTPDQIAWMEGKVGPYPFETYGVIMANATTGFELETQTLSLFEKKLFTEPAYPKWYVESVMVHELSHQWFGDSVSPASWSDVWLNEGHATWYEALYAEEKGHQPMIDRMKAAYAASDGWRASGGPPARPKLPAPGQKISIFRPSVYDGAALALYALRQEIGRPAFERLERLWVRDHRDANASTDDYIALASEVAGRDLSGFLHDWLYGEKTPPMPGHPDWKPADPPAKSPKAAKRPAHR